MIKAFNLPINSVSFGQVSTALLKFLFEKKENGIPIENYSVPGIIYAIIFYKIYFLKHP